VLESLALPPDINIECCPAIIALIYWSFGSPEAAHFEIYKAAPCNDAISNIRIGLSLRGKNRFLTI
jgi:hypothetical protein